MKLLKFRAQNFRSVKDSGWVEIDDVGALIGINESGKSNLLAPLWKLNPAEGGEIHPLSDYPRSEYNKIKNLKSKPKFIEAYFELNDELAEKVSKITDYPAEEVRVSSVSRDFNGDRIITFPNVNLVRSISKARVEELLRETIKQLETLDTVTKGEETLKPAMTNAIENSLESLGEMEAEITSDLIEAAKSVLSELDTSTSGKHSTIGPRFGQLIDDLSSFQEEISKPDPQSFEEVKQLVVDNMPVFVYYSNYGNLDSEIYLPHVIENMDREDLGPKEEAKVRTLKVLFDFVKLKPKEILALGQEEPNATEEELEETAEKKRERDVLLQSAASALTKEFREWWKQGEYRFRFAADGNHFRILVSDDKRPEEIELEARSTGLQWFLSFFLVFLVEAKDSHAGAMLLLDEPGLTLHPLAQRDLAVFFEGLAGENQLIFSTHSPFMVESDRLDRVKAVYVDDDGQTAVSADLRAAAPKSVRAKSIYAAHAALGLTVSDVILQGCQPVVVEGQSDQYYLSALKNYMVGEGLTAPSREIVFIPGGGTKAIKTVASILAAKEDELPFVILDSDKPGLDLAKSLRSGLYVNQKDRVLVVGEILEEESVEIEDVFPRSVIADVFSRECRGKDEDFVDVVKETPIVPQMEAFAAAQGVVLEQGWKVDLARAVKKRVQQKPALLSGSDRTKAWVQIFDILTGCSEATGDVDGATRVSRVKAVAAENQSKTIQ